MEDYTKEDVLQALSKITVNSRKRVLVDQRSYLIGILAYRFMLSEHTIAKLTNIKRYSINYNKKIVLDFHKDKSYIHRSVRSGSRSGAGHSVTHSYTVRCSSVLPWAWLTVQQLFTRFVVQSVAGVNKL